MAKSRKTKTAKPVAKPAPEQWPTYRPVVDVDAFGRVSYGNYSIEPWHTGPAAGTWSIYNRYNSMYDCRDGFRSIDEAVAYIDKYR